MAFFLFSFFKFREKKRKEKPHSLFSFLFLSLSKFFFFFFSFFKKNCQQQELIALHVMAEEGEEDEGSEVDEEEGAEAAAERKRFSTPFPRRRKPVPNAAAGRGAPARAALASAASSLGARVLRRDKHSLNLITNNAAHQGVVLESGPLEWERTSSLLEAEEERRGREEGGGGGRGSEAAAAPTTRPPPPTLLSSFSSAALASSSSSSDSTAPIPPSRIPVWLVLDQVADPQNLGAILRSALFLGASGVLLSPKNCAPASAAASKASAGALEWLRVSAAARPLPALLREAAREGNWAVLGADAGREGARSARGTAMELLLGSTARGSRAGEGGGETSPRPPPPAGVALVLGSEGAGLRPVVAAECTRFVKVSGRRRGERGGGRNGSKNGSVGNSGGGGTGSSGTGSGAPEGGGGGGKGAAAVGSGEGAVDSLNVSVAAALLLHDLLDVFGGEEGEDEE